MKWNLANIWNLKEDNVDNFEPFFFPQLNYSRKYV